MCELIEELVDRLEELDIPVELFEAVRDNISESDEYILELFEDGSVFEIGDCDCECEMDNTIGLYYGDLLMEAYNIKSDSVLSQYFDYEAYGKDMRIERTFIYVRSLHKVYEVLY